MTITSCAHVALRCADAQQTVDFYQGILGLKMTIADRVETYMGKECLYLHLFFKLGDGNFIAFFDTPDFAPMSTKPDPSQPIFAPHYAYFATNPAEVDEYKARLVRGGVSVTGPVVRAPFHSIYFSDPSGHRIEITAHLETSDDRYAEDEAKAARVLAGWNVEKAQRKQPAMA
jgi:catechol 2,3-dioxygenase-like lactoylglutathione lyase family enzyme